VRGVPLFVQQLCVDGLLDVPALPGRYDEERGLRVDASGLAIAAALGMPTRSDRDRPDDRARLATATKAQRDRPDDRVPLPTGRRAISDRTGSPAFERDLMLSTRTKASADSDDDWLLLGTVTWATSDRDK
jgi:hypothetical protein